MWADGSLLCLLFVLCFCSIHAAGNFIDTEPSYNDHPLLQSLDKYQFLSPLQYEDFHHEHRKNTITTELTNTPGIHHPDAYFVVEFEGKKFTLDLSINRELLPESFATTYYSHKGEQIMHKPNHQERNHCYYQGFVREVEDSQVIASTCNGLRGCIILPNDVLMIEPLSNNRSLSDYIIYRPRDRKEISPKSCGNDNNDRGVNQLMEKFDMYSEAMNISRIRRKREVGTQRKFVELMIVADSREARIFKTRIALDARIKELANFVDGFYQKLGIRVVLSHVEVWNHTDRIALSSNPTTTLDNFLNYRIQRRRTEPASSAWVYADNVHLLYGGDFDGSTIGKATVGTMCDTRSGGVNQDHSSDVINTAATVAHEMGHNFGMQHDTSSCSCPSGAQCIMAASSGRTRNRAWSSCSEQYLEQNLNMGLESCLLNVPDPSRLYGGPECGNDIVEEGEECDCGDPDFCRSQCCDARTCRLLSNAVCDGGSCCDNCQFVSAGTECRAASNNECELPEFCTGSSPFCPENVYKEEGTPCLEGSAVCHDGVCLTHTKQCQNIWGSDAANGPDQCYSHVNIQGNANGNCGKNANGQFIRCTNDNVKCGKLICVGGERFPLIARDRFSYTNTLTTNSRTIQCRTIGSPTEDTDSLDPGLVRSGTSCAPGKVCFNGECQDIPTLSCTARCNGNGVCNNHGNCHCNDGYAPPFCSQRGSGGSIDSGPMRGQPVVPRPRTVTPPRPFFFSSRTLSRPAVTSSAPKTSRNGKPLSRSTQIPDGSDSDKNSDVEAANTDSPVTVIVVVVMVILLVLVVVALVVWCRYFGGKNRLDTWRKNRKKKTKPSGHDFQPVPTEDSTINATVRHSTNVSDLRKQPITISRENLIGSNSNIAQYADTDTPTQSYYSNYDSYHATNSAPSLSYQAPAYQPPAPSQQVRPTYKPVTTPPHPPGAPNKHRPPQPPKAKPFLPASKPPVISTSKPPFKPSSPPKPVPAQTFSPPKPATKPGLPTKPAQKPSPPRQAVRTAPPPPTGYNGAKYAKPSPMLPTKPTPSSKPLVPSAPPMSVAERARRFNNGV